jgi:hypothetical protein
MQSLDGDLEALSGELERLDYVVVKHGDFVCVTTARGVTRSSLAAEQTPALGEASAQYTCLDHRAADPVSVVR